MTEPLHIISLGAGVQSSTMALMAARGKLKPMPSAAIFSDTRCEPLEVYRWLDWLEGQLPFPVIRVVHKRGLLHNIMKAVQDKGRFVGAPFHTESGDGGGILRRQCTKEFKIEPIMREIRRLLGLRRGQRGGREVRVVQWIGISLDEAAMRMKPSRAAYVKNIWPLVEARMTRHDCLLWMKARGYPQPPRSACTFCPYHSDGEWRRLMSDPRSRKQIVAVDKLIRRQGKTRERLFLHRSLKPIDEIDFIDPEDRDQIQLFQDECEGMCGL